MFAVDPQLTYLEAAREQVVAIIESVNQPHVAIPGKPPQPAQGYVAGVRNSNASFSIYVYLLLSQSHEPVVFTHPQRNFPLESYREIETEALNFVESMGFMMENVNFRNLSREAQEELIGRLPLFAELAGEEEATIDEGLEIDEQSQNLARLLGAF